MKVLFPDMGVYKPHNLDEKLVREGMELVKKALLADYEDEKRRGTGLPKDWRERNLK